MQQQDIKDQCIVVARGAINFLRISDGMGTVRFYGPSFYEVDKMVRATAEALMKKLPGFEPSRLGIAESKDFIDWLCTKWREDGEMPEDAILECADNGNTRDTWQTAIREANTTIEKDYSALEAVYGPGFARVGS